MAPPTSGPPKVQVDPSRGPVFLERGTADAPSSTRNARSAEPGGATSIRPESDTGPFCRLARVAPWRRLSHELGTPLHAILGHAELLLEGSFGPLGGEARACVSEIQGAGRQLALEFRRLLLIVEACGSPRLEEEPIDCRAIFETAFADRPVSVRWHGAQSVIRGERFWFRTMVDAIADAVAGEGRGGAQLVVVSEGRDLELSSTGCPLVEGVLDAITQALIEVVIRRQYAEAQWLNGNRLRIRGLRPAGLLVE